MKMTEADRREFVELLNECGCAAAERALHKYACIRVSEHTDSKAAAVALLTWIECYAERAVAAHTSGVLGVGANTVPHHTPMVGKDEQ